MRSTIPLLLAPLLLTGSVALSSRPHGNDQAAPGAVRCIDPHLVVARHPAPPGAVIFEMAGGTTYRNDLIGACPGAARADSGSIVQIEPDSGNLCTNDHVRIYDPVEVRNTGATAACRLGMFTPIPSR